MERMLGFFSLMLTVSLYSCQEIVIKNAQEKHLPAIEKLARTVFFEDIKPLILRGYANSPTVEKGEVDIMLENWLQRHYERYATSIKDTQGTTHQLLIAQDKSKDNEIVGFCCCEKQKIEDRHRNYIYILAVNTAMRRCGVGKMLGESALKVYPDVESCEWAALAHENEDLQAIYDKHGFKKGILRTLNMPAKHTVLQLDVNSYSVDIQKK